jgi:hypothetical protein
MLIILYNLTASMFPQKPYLTSVHKNLYVDRHCSDKQFELIKEAAHDWSVATHNIATFTVAKMPTAVIVDPQETIIINLVSEDSPDILALDLSNPKSQFLGLYNNRGFISEIELVGNRLEIDDFKGIVLHEMGHSLGLKHNEAPEGMFTLMFSTANFGSDTITPTDVHNFCKIYHCKL